MSCLSIHTINFVAKHIAHLLKKIEMFYFHLRVLLLLLTIYSTPGKISKLGLEISSLPACANSKFQRSGVEHR